MFFKKTNWGKKKKTMSAGKGDKPRPVKKQKYNENYDKIVWKKQEKNPAKIFSGKVRYSY
jgi:hypothetical protein